MNTFSLWYKYINCKEKREPDTDIREEEFVTEAAVPSHSADTIYFVIIGILGLICVIAIGIIIALFCRRRSSQTMAPNCKVSAPPERNSEETRNHEVSSNPEIVYNEIYEQEVSDTNVRDNDEQFFPTVPLNRPSYAAFSVDNLQRIRPNTTPYAVVNKR